MRILKECSNMDETLLRLQLLISDQIQDLQRNKNTVNNYREYITSYMETLKLIRLLRENPNIKLVCHDGKFWKQEDIDKKYYKDIC